MAILNIAARLYASLTPNKAYKRHEQAQSAQMEVFHALLKKAAGTAIAKDLNFKDIHTVSDFQHALQIGDYEKHRAYIDRIISGEQNVLWPGLPIYFAKTSGTTSGEKYIPITSDSIDHHITAAKNSLLHYIHRSNNTSFINGHMIFLQGSPVLEKKGSVATGRLSGIVYHHVPSYLHGKRMPSYEVNCMESWEEKLDAIVMETLQKSMSLVSGIPPWMVMYFERLLDKSGKQSVSELFPDLSLLVYGGVNFEPYREKLKVLMGKEIDSIETYPASEGFIAFQDDYTRKGMLLNLEAGIFYEFIKADEVSFPNARRYLLWEVELGVSYALVLSTNAGLWAYLIGDLVEFVSLNPYRIIVKGRVSQFISAFGEHVIMEEVESAMAALVKEHSLQLNDFSVAPMVAPAEGLPYHEWFVEWKSTPENLATLEQELDHLMRSRNSYYDDLVAGNVIQSLKIRSLPLGFFHAFLSEKGRIGGQFKIVRLSNDRQNADEWLSFLKKYCP